EKSGADPLAAAVDGDLGDAAVRRSRQPGEIPEDHAQAIAVERALRALGDQDDRAFRLEMHPDPGGHGDVGFPGGLEPGIDRRVEVPQLAPEADDRVYVRRAGRPDQEGGVSHPARGYFWFFQADGSGALEVVRRTFMKARVRTVRKSSGS